jgi:TolA-binding protein
MRTIALILLAALLAACATPRGEYCDPEKPGFIRGLRCSQGGYENYIGNIERERDQEKVISVRLQDRRQQLIRKKEEREKELASLRRQLDSLNRNIQILEYDIDRLKDGQARNAEQAAQIKDNLFRVSSMLIELSHTYELVSNSPGKYNISYQQARELRATAQEAQTLAERIRGFLIDVLIPDIWDFIPMRKNLKIALSILKVGWAFYNHFVRA